MMDKLPVPNEVEMKPFNKVKYHDRIFDSGLNGKKYGLDDIEFAKFIHQTFEHWIHNRKHINVKEFKKM